MMTSEPVASGQDLALRMQAAYPDQDWVALLAAKSGNSRDFVEWHLQEEMAPPAHLTQAAHELLDDAAVSDRSRADSKP